MTLRAAAAPPARLVARSVVRARTRAWSDYSHLFAVGDRGGWSVDEDAAHLRATARRLGYTLGPASWAKFASHQCVFLTSHFEALDERWLQTSHRLATAYLHGRPGTPGAPEFDDAYERLRESRDRLACVQVTHEEMHELVLSAGVDADRVFRIPIGIDLENFSLGGHEERARVRAALSLPASAFVVGSFQKDGVGWEEGLEPKLVKGPDVLVAVLERVRDMAPELHVLLTGPARGYVRRELDRLGIPHVHTLARGRTDLAHAYRALDAYLVSSRQEGGPKAALESLASGTPLVATRVGQAQELLEDGRDALLVDVEDVEALSNALVRVRDDAELVSSLRSSGRATAERYANEKLDARWEPLLATFVERPAS